LLLLTCCFWTESQEKFCSELQIEYIYIRIVSTIKTAGLPQGLTKDGVENIEIPIQGGYNSFPLTRKA
jgi:hypothetical protein